MVQIVVSDLGTIKLAQQSLKGMPAEIERASEMRGGRGLLPEH